MLVYFKPLMKIAMLLFKFEALLSCITLFFANLSNIETTFGANAEASALEVIARNLRKALRVVLW